MQPALQGLPHCPWSISLALCGYLYSRNGICPTFSSKNDVHYALQLTAWCSNILPRIAERYRIRITFICGVPPHGSSLDVPGFWCRSHCCRHSLMQEPLRCFQSCYMAMQIFIIYIYYIIYTCIFYIWSMQQAQFVFVFSLMCVWLKCVQAKAWEMYQLVVLSALCWAGTHWIIKELHINLGAVVCLFFGSEFALFHILNNWRDSRVLVWFWIHLNVSEWQPAETFNFWVLMYRILIYGDQDRLGPMPEVVSITDGLYRT